MRKVRIDKLNLEITEEGAKYNIGCPFATDGSRLCYTTCAWFRIERCNRCKKSNDKPPKDIPYVEKLAYCGDKLVGEIAEAKE